MDEVRGGTLFETSLVTALAVSASHKMRTRSNIPGTGLPIPYTSDQGGRVGADRKRGPGVHGHHKAQELGQGFGEALKGECV